MRKIFKVFLNAIILSAFFLAIPLGNANAASGLSYFYKDSSNTKCENGNDCSSFLHIGSNTVYQINHADNKINALDLTGKRKWTYTLPKDINEPSRNRTYNTDNKGNFYFGYSLNGTYYVASISSKGKLNWKFALTNDGGPSKPLIAKDGTVYFGTGNPTNYIGPYNESYLYAVSASGKLKWKVKLAGDSLASNIFTDKSGNIIVDGVDSDQLSQYTISAKGKVVSSKNLSDNNVGIDSKGNQYTYNYGDSILTVKDRKGKKLWSYKAKNDYLSIEYISQDGYVYVSEDGFLKAIYGGQVKWKVKGDVYKTFASSKGLYTLMSDYTSDNQNTTVKLIDAKTGKIKGTITYNFTIQADSAVLHPSGFLLFSKDIHINKISF